MLPTGSKRSVVSLAVDHCHTTGKFRGFLCSNCNTVLGLVHENITTLQFLINYLEGHQIGGH